MSSVKIQGNASGSGAFTIAAPNSDTNRTITLPDETGTLLSDESSLDASKLTGSLPAIDGSSLTGISGGLQSMQVFTTVGSSTWTKPSGITKIRVYVTGGGGGGGGGTSNFNGGQGGGAAGTAIKLIDVSAVSSVSVTIGGGGAAGARTLNGSAGGTSSFGAYCSSPGGGAGLFADGTSTENGSTPTGGDLNIKGGDGGQGGGGATQDDTGCGVGGASYWGGGGHAAKINNGVDNAGPGKAYGSGGGGGSDISGTEVSSGSGQSGLIVVEEYA